MTPTEPNRRRARKFAILSLVATAGLPVLFLLLRWRIITFRDDFTGFNALGFALTWAPLLILTGAVLGGLAWHADRRSWLARFAFGINVALLAGVIWLLVALRW